MANRFGPVFKFTPGQVVETIDGLVGYVKYSGYNYSDCSEYNYSGYTWHGPYYRILVQDNCNNYNLNNRSMSYSNIKDNETGKQFKKRVEKLVAEFCGKKTKCDVYEEAFYRFLRSENLYIS